MSDPVRLERRGSVALLTLDRPDRLNALDVSLLDAIEARASEVAADGSLLAVVVTGEGRAFAAGADIAAMRKLDPSGAEAFSALGHRAFGALEALAVPTIAAVNGFALGGGCELACACDWIYASSKARFGQPEVNLGLIPGFGGTTRLPRRVGVAWALELVCSGEPIDADTALRIGLVNRVFEPDALVDAAVAMGETIAKKGPLAVARAKQLVHRLAALDLPVANSVEQTAFGAISATEDRGEGMDAFLAKRDPQFRGR